MYPSQFGVPFVRQLDGPMQPGRTIALYGTIPHHCSRFAVNLQCGGAPSSVSDIALHVSVRLDEQCVVRNAQVGGAGCWQHEERDGGLPHSLRRGGHCQLLLLCEPHGFKIAFNGQHFREFRHRLPFQRVTHVGVEGDIQIDSASGVLGSHGSGEHQEYNPTVPCVKHIGSIYPGRCVRVRGVLPPNAYRFSVNLATGPSMDYDDIALHVSTRPSEGMVELNSCRRGGWESSQQQRPCPLRPGQHFEMMVLVDDYGYKVAYNGVHFAEFPHRHPYQGVNHVIVEGSVQLQQVSAEGQPRGGGGGGGFAPPPHMPPPPPHYPSPYGDQGQGHFPNPYPTLY